MNEPPSLFCLCIDSVNDIILFSNDDVISSLRKLPPDVIDSLIGRLPAVALHKFEDALQLNYENEHGGGSESPIKRRCENFDAAWKKFFQPVSNLIPEPADCSYFHSNYDFKNNWKELFWNFHIQNCLNFAASQACLPHFEGCFGEIKFTDVILSSLPSYMGLQRTGSYSKIDYSKVAYHCQHFGIYARCLTVPCELLQAETSHWLSNCKLEALNIKGLNSGEQVEALCEILSRNVETLASLHFSRCSISSEFVNAICSLLAKDLPTHKIKHFGVDASGICEADSTSMPDGVVSFLSSARCLHSAYFHDSKLQQISARRIFDALLGASSNVAVLDISENNMCGWLYNFRRKPNRLNQCTLNSMRVLKLRNNMLLEDDADCLTYALLRMSNLETLDLSENSIKDEGLKTLIPYFTRMAEGLKPLVNLLLESCDLTHNGVKSLLQVLSSFKKPLNSLHIGGNTLGRRVGVHLGKFICTGITELYLENIEINSSGFRDALEQITEDVKLVFINIRDNPGGVGAARFISKLLESAPGLIKIDASGNNLPAGALSIIGSSLKTAKGNIQHLNLTENYECDGPASRAMLEKFVVDRHINITWPDSVTSSF